MTREQYEKATNLRIEMDMIEELKWTIANATEGKYLATIKDTKFGEVTGVLVDYDVMNYAKLPKHIMEKFEKILNEELERLDKEFREL